MPARLRLRRWPPELIALSALALVTRFWGLFHPHAVIFDEVYYEKFTADYLAHNFYVDVHPPLAEQIFALAAKCFHISIATLAHPSPAPVLRIIPALAGALIVPMCYVLLRRLGMSRQLALFGGALLLFDNALLVESRAILPDSMLVFCGLTAVTVFLGARRRTGRARWWRLAVAAAFAGLAVSFKWTGLNALGIIGLIMLVDAVRARGGWMTLLREGALVLAIPVAIYLSVFAVHFAWETHSGPGTMFMSGAFKATLVGSQNYDPNARMPFYKKFWELNRAMRLEDASMVGLENSSASAWYTWPTIQRPITFWVDSSHAEGRQASVYLEGNPVVWYGIIVAIAIGAVGFWRRRERWRAWREPALILGLAYVANFLPFAAIQRLMYQYSYFMAFVYSAGLAALGLGVGAGWTGPEPLPDGAADDGPLWQFPSRRSARLYWCLLALVVAGFIFFAPETYGWTTSEAAFQARFWLVQRHY